jgi:hypothetical protein
MRSVFEWHHSVTNWYSLSFSATVRIVTLPPLRTWKSGWKSGSQVVDLERVAAIGQHDGGKGGIGLSAYARERLRRGVEGREAPGAFDPSLCRRVLIPPSPRTRRSGEGKRRWIGAAETFACTRGEGGIGLSAYARERLRRGVEGREATGAFDPSFCRRVLIPPSPRQGGAGSHSVSGSVLRRRLPAPAERVGFEPTGPCGPSVFKTDAIDHSATSPGAGCGVGPVVRAAGFEPATPSV